MINFDAPLLPILVGFGLFGNNGCEGFSCAFNLTFCGRAEGHGVGMFLQNLQVVFVPGTPPACRPIMLIPHWLRTIAECPCCHGHTDKHH